MLDEPTFLVQLGAAGRKRAKKALEGDYADGVVLSPSDYGPEKLKEIADLAHRKDRYVLFDPHFYLPHHDERDDLRDFDYFTEYGGSNYNSGVLATDANREEFSSLVIDAQDQFSVDAYITPALLMESISEDEIDDWSDLCESYIEMVNEIGRDIPVFHSIPVDGFQLTDEKQRSALLNRATGMEGDGFYTAIQYNDSDIRLPVMEKENVYSYLELLLGLRVNRYEVIASHTHQIAHLLFSIDVNAIAAGHYQNLRTFDTDRWTPTPEDEIRRNVPRYYSDSLLTAIRPTGLLSELAQKSEEGTYDIDDIRMSSPFDDDLFDSPIDTFGEEWNYKNAAWEHTIYGMNQATKQYAGQDIEDRIEHCKGKIKNAKEEYEEIEDLVDTVSEIDQSFYDDWLDALNEIKNLPEMRRL